MSRGIGLKSTFESLGLAAQVGFSVVASIGVCLFLGMWIDARWNTAPWATFVLSLAGVFLGGLSTYRVASTVIQRVAADQASGPAAAAGPSAGRSLWLATRLGLVLSAPVLVSFFVGAVIDRWLDSSPWATLLLAALGLVAGTAGAYRLGSTLVQQVQASRPPTGGGSEGSE